MYFRQACFPPLCETPYKSGKLGCPWISPHKPVFHFVLTIRNILKRRKMMDEKIMDGKWLPNSFSYYFTSWPNFLNRPLTSLLIRCELENFLKVGCEYFGPRFWCKNTHPLWLLIKDSTNRKDRRKETILKAVRGIFSCSKCLSVGGVLKETYIWRYSKFQKCCFCISPGIRCRFFWLLFSMFYHETIVTTVAISTAIHL